MYPRKNYFLFRGFTGLFFLIGAIVIGSLIFRLGLSRGMLAAGGELRSVNTAPIVLDTTNLLVIFGGIILVMIVGFIFRLIYWKQIGKERLAFFADNTGEFARMGYGRKFRNYSRHHRPGCWYWDDDEETPEKSSDKEKSAEG